MTIEDRPTPMSAERLRSLIGLLEGTDVEEIEVSCGESRVRVFQDAMQPVQAGETAQTSTTAGEVAVTAPLTGVYYAKPSPEQEPFVVEGADILPGQVVALIETMKLFNEVVSEVEGRVSNILPSEGDLVEKGQTLMQIEPGESLA